MSHARPPEDEPPPVVVVVPPPARSSEAGLLALLGLVLAATPKVLEALRRRRP